MREISQNEHPHDVKEQEQKAAIAAVVQFTGPKQGIKEKGPEEKDLNACSRCKKIECYCYSEAKGYRFCYKCGKPWKHHDACRYNEKGLPSNTRYAAMN